MRDESNASISIPMNFSWQQTTGVRAMSFNPDGRTLLCGLHESLKVFSWEPVRCHDAVDVGWSRLSDLNIHEGKLLGCSYNQSCVGVWVVDVSRIEPHAIASIGRLNSRAESKSTTNSNLVLQIENNIKVSMGRLSVSQNAEPVVKEAKPASNGSAPSTPQKLGINSGPKVKAVNSALLPSSTPLKKSSSKSHGSTNPQLFSKSDVVPVVVPRTTNSQAFNKSDVVPVTVPRKSSRMELTSEFTKNNSAARTVPFNAQSKLTDFRKYSNIRNDSYKESGLMSNKTETNEGSDQDSFSADSGVNRPASAGDRNVEDVRFVRSVKIGVSHLPDPSASCYNENCEIRVHKPRHSSSVDIPKGGRTRSLVANWEKEEPYASCEYLTSNNSSDTWPTSAISYMVLRQLWGRKDVRGLISAMEKMSDHSVSADVLSVLMEKIDLVTLDICTNLLPLLTSLLESKMDRVILDFFYSIIRCSYRHHEFRHLSISVEMLLKLVKVFGNVIHSTVTAGPLAGVDLQAEQRLEGCNLCFIELEKLEHILPSLTRRGGSLGKSTQELNLALQEVI